MKTCHRLIFSFLNSFPSLAAKILLNIRNQLLQCAGQKFIFVINNFKTPHQRQILNRNLLHIILMGQKGLGEDGDALAGGYDVDDGIGAVAYPFGDDGDAPLFDDIGEEFPGAGALFPEDEVLAGYLGELDGISGGEGMVLSTN